MSKLNLKRHHGEAVCNVSGVSMLKDGGVYQYQDYEAGSASFVRVYPEEGKPQQYQVFGRKDFHKMFICMSRQAGGIKWR